MIKNILDGGGKGKTNLDITYNKVRKLVKHKTTIGIKAAMAAKPSVSSPPRPFLFSILKKK